MYKQLIIARKDLNMSPGKLAAQVSHGSMAFLATLVRGHTSRVLHLEHGRHMYETSFSIDKEVYDQWINDAFTKVVLEAKNKNQLLKAKTIAESFGLKEDKDFFLIRDNCMTELTPEEDGKTLTCIGFIPLDSEIADKIGKKYQLWH